jgi:hypothetical protein
MSSICVQSSDTLTVGRGVGVKRGVGVRVGVGVGVIVRVGVMVGVADWGGAVTVAVEDGVSVGTGDGVEVKVTVPVGVAVTVALGVTDGVLVSVAVRVAVAVGEKVWVGVAECVGLAAGDVLTTTAVASGAGPHAAKKPAAHVMARIKAKIMERRLSWSEPRAAGRKMLSNCLGSWPKLPGCPLCISFTFLCRNY